MKKGADITNHREMGHYNLLNPNTKKNIKVGGTQDDQEEGEILRRKIQRNLLKVTQEKAYIFKTKEVICKKIKGFIIT